MATTISRLPAVLRVRGKSRSAHYLDIKQGLFTRPVKIGRRAAAWPDEEIDALTAAVIRGATEDELRELVRNLEADRKRVGVDKIGGSRS